MQEVQVSLAGVQIPFYQCHKKVQAAMITEILEDHDPSGQPPQWFTLMFGQIGTTMKVHLEWMERFKPEVGGYYVLYQDGYTSFSPASAFEEGYTKI